VQSKDAEMILSTNATLEFKPQKQAASFKLDDGLGDVDGISIESTTLADRFLSFNLPPRPSLKGEKLELRYLVSLKKGTGTEPEMSQMTFEIQPALRKDMPISDGWVSLAVVKNDELDYDNWYLREHDGKLYVELNDATPAFETAGTFKLTPPKFDVCPGKPMCSERGTCENIQNGIGKCRCQVGLKGDACQMRVVNAVDPFVSSDKFSYTGSNAPDTWWKLDPKWKTCKDGKLQSPIAFTQSTSLLPLSQNQFLSIEYKVSPISIVRHGKDIKVVPLRKGKSFVNSGGFQYEFSHMEIHVPGEHAFAGKVNSKCEAGTDCPYDCEFHLVHTKSSSSGIELGQTLDDAKEAPASDASDSEKPPPKPKDAARTTDSALGALVQEEKNARAQGKLESTKEQPIDASILILAIPGQVGTRPNTVFQQLIEGMPEKDSEKHLLGEFNFADILPENPTYYRYSGSLTKPPCTEDVIWYVFQDPVEVGAEQMQTMYDKNGKNARPVQHLNDRPISAAIEREDTEANEL